MADKYVIQIAKEGGAQTYEKDENGEDKKTSDGRSIVASIDTESQINFVCDNDNINLECIDKKIKNKLQNNESFTKKREETERFKKFSYDEIITRDKTNLDITWIKDESLESLENLPEPKVLADEIISNLEDALNDFKSIVK